jgi:dipeptidase E
MIKRIFLTSSVNFVAADIAKKLGGAKKRKLLYIYTAGELKKGEAQWQKDDRLALSRAGFEVIKYTITGKTREAIKKDISKVAVIYIGGGNTFYLLDKIQQARCAGIIRDAVKAGKIYIGTSAGSIVAGPDIYPTYSLDKAEVAKKMKSFKGLGLVDFIVMPHWGSDNFKSRYLSQRFKDNYNEKNKLIFLNNYQYVGIRDDWYRIEDVRHKNR